MTPEHRAFNERYAARWSERASARRAAGRPVDIAIAGALNRIVAELHAELAAAPLIDPADAPITWKHPVFNAAGRFNPFAGTYAEQMLASAAACERMGYADVAQGYRSLAANLEAGAPPPQAPEPERRPAARQVWSGPPQPPAHDPVPFTAGEQMGFGL
jgi:hypothetical protein